MTPYDLPAQNHTTVVLELWERERPITETQLSRLHELIDAATFNINFDYRMYYDCSFMPICACLFSYYAYCFRAFQVVPLKVGATWLPTLNGKLCTYMDRHTCEWFGITPNEANQVFGSRGCGNARNSAQAVQWLTNFIANKLANSALIALHKA